MVQELRHSPARDTSCENEALLCAAEVAVHDKGKGRKTVKHKSKRNTETLLALAILILLFPFSAGAATSDDFIRGYAAAVLEREFQIKDYSLEVSDQTVKVTSGELKSVDPEKVIAALFAVQGVKKVEILDPQGIVIASSVTSPPQAPAVAATSRENPPMNWASFPVVICLSR